MTNTITTFTKAETKAIKKLHLDRFYSESVGAFIMTYDEACELSYVFYTKICNAFKEFNNSVRVWRFEPINEDIYILYKTNK